MQPFAQCLALEARLAWVEQRPRPKDCVKVVECATYYGCRASIRSPRCWRGDHTSCSPSWATRSPRAGLSPAVHVHPPYGGVLREAGALRVRTALATPRGGSARPVRLHDV